MFTEDDLDGIALAARQVIADGLPLTGENLERALTADDEKPGQECLASLIDGVVNSLHSEPDPGVAVIDIGSAAIVDIRREIESRGLTVVGSVGVRGRDEDDAVLLINWPHLTMNALSDGLREGRKVVVTCHCEDDVDTAWSAIDGIVESDAVLDQAAPGVVDFKAATLHPENGDLSRAIDGFKSLLSQRGLIVAGPGATGAELEAHLPFLGARHPSIKLVNGESVTAVEEVREAMDMGFAVNVCFDHSRPDRMNPGLEDLL